MPRHYQYSLCSPFHKMVALEALQLRAERALTEKRNHTNPERAGRTSLSLGLLADRVDPMVEWLAIETCMAMQTSGTWRLR